MLRSGDFTAAKVTAYCLWGTLAKLWCVSVQPSAPHSCVTESIRGAEMKPCSLQRREVWNNLGWEEILELWAAPWWWKTKLGAES